MMSTNPDSTKGAGEPNPAPKNEEIASTAETTVAPPFINNWAPLPSTASATNSIGLNSSLNLNMNLVNFYGSGSGSVISGPPLLGGVMMSTNNSNNAGNAANIRSDYYSFPVSGNNNNQAIGSSAMNAGTSAGMSIPSPADGLQRSHSNSFTGFAYNQNPTFNSNSGSMNSLNTSTLGQPGGLSGSHIDFMNINNSPPLLSSASSTSPGLFLSNMTSKGDNMNMMNHSNLFTNMHGILPNSSGSYSNLINLNSGGNNEPGAVPQTNVGAKRPATSTLNPATAAAVVAANKKAKANAARARAASDVSGQPPGPGTGFLAAPVAPTGLSQGNPAGQLEGSNVSSTAPISHAMAPPTAPSTATALPATSAGPVAGSTAAAPAGSAVAPLRAGGPLPATQQQHQSNAYYTASGPPTLQPGQQDGRQLAGAAGYYAGSQTVAAQQTVQQGNHNYAQHPHSQLQQQHSVSYNANNQSSAPSGGAGFYGASSTGAGYGHPQTQQPGLSQAQHPHSAMQHSMQAPSQQQGGMLQGHQGALQQQGGMQAGGLAQGAMQHGPAHQQATVHQGVQHGVQHGVQQQQSGNMQHGQQIHLQNPTGVYVPGNPSSQVSPRSMGYIPQTGSNNASGDGMVTYPTSTYPSNAANSSYSMQMQSGYHPAHTNSGNPGNYSQVQYHHANQGQMQLAQSHQQNQAPIYTPGVIPPNKMGMAPVPVKQARVRATKPPKAAKKAPTVGVVGNIPSAALYDGAESSSSVAGQDAIPSEGPPLPPVKPLTYKEKRAMSSKKAMAAAAAAEAQRNGELPPSMRAEGETKRKEPKKDKDSTADGERHEKEKAEKEESLTTLLKRREPIASRLEDIEDSKFLGRKAPIAPTPDILPVQPLGEVIKTEALDSCGMGTGSIASCFGSRPKTHWDYLLEEVQWMALDFRQELRWKLGAAKHTAEACSSRSSQCTVPQILADTGCPKESTVGGLNVAANPLGLAVRRSASDGKAARTVALTLSRSVQSYWTAVEEKVVSSSRNGANLRDFLSRVSKEDTTAVDIFDTSDDENDAQAAAPTSPAVALSKMIDKILSVPTLISATQQEVVKVEANTPANEKARTSHRKTRSPSTAREEAATVTPVVTVDPTVVLLQAHQHAAVAHVEALNKLSFGAAVCGKPYIGKTVACCTIIRQWLSAAHGAADTVLLVAPRTSAARWMAELRSASFLGEIELWSDFPGNSVTLKAEKANKGTVHGSILFVPEDVLVKYLQSPAFRSLTVKAESAEPAESESTVPSARLCGAVVDLRRVRCSAQDQPDHTSTFLSQLTAHLPVTVTRRCLVREDAHQLDNILETLCFLCPGTVVSNWRAKFPTEHVSSKRSTTVVSDAHLDQINRNTVSQLLANLTVLVKLPGNADSVVAAQTRMETIAAEMDPTQARSYNLLMTHILSHSAARSGENTAQLAHALILLRKVCFHASLLCHTGHHLGPRAVSASSITSAKYATTASPITVDGGYYAGGLVNPALRPATHPSSGSELYWAPSADRPASQWRPTGPALHSAPANPSSDYVSQMSTGYPSAPLAEVSFAQGPIAVSSSKFREVPTQEGLELGSCKLVCLRRLVRRFAGLKVAVVIETSEECVLVQQLLSVLNVKYDTAFHCDHQHDRDRLTDADGHDCSPFQGVSKALRWMDAQNSVQAFNSPHNNSSFLLCSKHVFQSPNSPPHQADAVVILSEDWVSTTDVKDCFRIRLLSAGPTGPPLTVVRVVAAASIEERMVRKGASFLQLQGTPLVQLRAGFHGHFPQTNGDPSKDSQHGIEGHDESTLLCKAPTLVLPSIPRPVSGGNNSLTSPANDTEGGVAKEAFSTLAVVPPKNKDSEEGGRGKGKGFIMVGKQGATTLVKEQDASQGMVLSRARTSSGDPLKHPDTVAWIQRLCASMRTAEAEFKQRNRSIKFSQAHDLVPHGLLSPLRLLNTVTDEDCTVDPATASTASNTVWSAAINEINYVLGRAVLGSCLAEQGSKQDKCHTRVLKILESRWHSNVHHLQTSHELEDDEQTNQVAVVTPDSARSLSDWEIRRLQASGLGLSAAESMLGALVLPYRANASMPQEPNTVSKVKSEAEMTAPSGWPQSFFVFRDVLAATRRQGISLASTLHVNPLQSACRNDTISASDYNRSRLSGDSICIKYIVDGAKGNTGTSRSSKSRRSRPSASRRKDQTGATAEGSAASGDGFTAAVEDGTVESTAGNAQQGGQEKDFEVGFLSDLDPMDSPQKPVPQSTNSSAPFATATAAALAVTSPNKIQKMYPQQSPGAIGLPAAAAAPSPSPATAMHSAPPMGRPVHVQESNYDSWHPTEDDIIICTQNAFSDPHFKRTENWLNKAQEQANNSRKRARTATEARLRYTWLCTTGRTQQRLQDPQVIAQIEHLKSFLSARQANAANGGAGAQGGSNVSSPALVRLPDSSPTPMPQH